MKKFILTLFVAFVALTSIFAAPKKSSSKAKTTKVQKSYDYQYGRDMGIGLNLGYPGSGLAIRYHNDDFRFLGGVSFNYKGYVSVDATGEYIFHRVEFDEKARHVLDLSAGIGAGVLVPLGNDGIFSLAFEAGLIANYNIPDSPFSIFLRGLYSPRLTFGKDVHFTPVDFAGSLGFVYNFPLDN